MTDPGDGLGGSRDGVRLDMPEESWLVLAESYAAGWRAECRDSAGDARDLGEPVPIDGFANGWRAPADCVAAEFRFGPQRAANAAYVLSGAGVAAVILLLLLAIRRRRPERLTAHRSLDRSGPILRPPVGTAVIASLAAGSIGAVLFALRSGPVAVLIVFALLRWGVTVRRLATLAGVGVLVLPLLYLVFPAEDKGGYSFEFTGDTMGAHWVADGVVFLLASAALLGAVARRRVRKG